MEVIDVLDVSLGRTVENVRDEINRVSFSDQVGDLLTYARGTLKIGRLEKSESSRLPERGSKLVSPALRDKPASVSIQSLGFPWNSLFAAFALGVGVGTLRKSYTQRRR